MLQEVVGLFAALELVARQLLSVGIPVGQCDNVFGRVLLSVVDQIIPPRFPARRNTLCVDLAQSILDVTFVDVSRYDGENLLRK